MRTVCIVLMACLLPIVPAGATDFSFHMSWDRDEEVTYATARPGDTLRVFIRVDAPGASQDLSLDNVVFGISSDCSITHLETKTLNDDVDVDWYQQAGCGEVSWTSIGCGVRVAEITEYVSEHQFLVDASQEGGAGYHLGSWSPDIDEPRLFIWQYNDCTGYLGEYFAIGDVLYLDVTTPNDDATWGAVKSLYRAP